eukprot:758729-Rhodomonas_salina.2
MVPGYAARCKISQQILVAAKHTKVKRTYIDSGCAISIINDVSLLENVREIKPILVQGVAGEHTINMAGDLHLPIVSNDGVTRMIVVNGVLYNEESPVNLVSVDQLCQ